MNIVFPQFGFPHQAAVNINAGSKLPAFNKK
jgi:hypothetical protein